MKRKLLLSVATACWMGLSSVGHAGLVTESIDFNDNLVPAGWNYVRYSTPSRNNIHVQNQRLEIGQVDSSGGIYRSFNSAGVTRLTVDYDGNIANVYWGQGSAVDLANDYANLSAGYASSFMHKFGFGGYQMGFGIRSAPIPPNVGSTPAVENVFAPVFGNYHMSTIFEEGNIFQTITSLDTSAIISQASYSDSSFHLGSMNYLILRGVTTTGESAWIDNVRINTISADVPEPGSLALLGLALAGLGATRRLTAA